MSDVASEIKVGDVAPDFTLKNQDGNEVTLSSFKGQKNVVLAFYPLDWSPVCTNENKCLTDDFPSFFRRQCRTARYQHGQLFFTQGLGRLTRPEAHLVGRYAS